MVGIKEAVGRNQPFVQVQSPPIVAQRAPTTGDTDYPKGASWIDESVSPAVLYFHIGGGDWNSNELTLSTDDTFVGALDTTASSSLAIKTYVDGVAIAGAPVATETTAGIGELATDVEAVAGTPSTGVLALLVTPSNLTPVFAAAPDIGGTTPGGAIFDDLSTDGNGQVSLVSNAAGLFDCTGAGIDLTLSSDAGRVIMNGEEAAANALTLVSAAGGLDVDVALQMNLASSQNAADAIVIAASAGGIDITATGAPAEDLDLVCTSGSVNITAGESAADSIVISSTIGGIDITCAGAAAGEDIDISSTGSSVNISASENAADAITIDASAGGIDITNTGTAGEDIDIASTGASVNLSSTEDAALAIYLHANGGVSETIRLRSDLGTGVNSIDILSDVGGLTFTSGLASADAININASDAAGGIDIDCGSAGFIVDAAAGAVSLDSALASNFTVTGAADLTLDSSAGSVNIAAGEAAADAISIQAAAGGIDMDGALQVSIVSSQAAGNAIVIDASNAAGGLDIDSGTGGMIFDTTGAISLDAAAASNFTCTGAFDLSLISTAGSVIVNAEEAVADAIQLTSAAGGLSASVALQMSLVSTQAAGNAIVIDASNAAGGIDMDCGSGGFALDAASGAISLDSALASNFTVTGAADLTLSSSAGSVIVSASESAVDALQLLSTAGGIDILASGAAAGEDIDIIATGSSVNIQSTESDAAAIVINASGAAGAIQLNSGTGGVVMDSGQTVNVTAVATAATPYAILGSDYFITTDTTGGALTLTLPAAPATGRSLVVYDGAGQAAAGGNITVDGNGKNVAFAGASAATQLLNTAYESMTLVYNGTLWCARDVV